MCIIFVRGNVFLILVLFSDLKIVISNLLSKLIYIFKKNVHYFCWSHSFERTSTVVRSAKETHQNDITDTTSNRTDTT